MRIRQRGIGQIISQKEERHAWLSAQAGQEASTMKFITHALNCMRSRPAKYHLRTKEDVLTIPAQSWGRLFWATRYFGYDTSSVL